MTISNSTAPSDHRATGCARVIGHLRNNVVAYIAVFFALGGGTAMAAGAVGSSQLAPIDVQTSTVNVPANSAGWTYAKCPAGEKLIGAAASWQLALGGNDDDPIYGTQFMTSVHGGQLHPVGYMAGGRNNTGAAQGFSVQISCLTN